MKGGIAPAMLKAAQIFWQEGLAGIKRGMNKAANYGLDLSDTQADYTDWIRRYEHTQGEPDIPSDVAEFEPPLISLIMTTCDPEPPLLTSALKSALAQHDPRWELCIADASSNPEVLQILKQSAKDHRIRVAFTHETHSVASGLNYALTMSRCEWIAVLGANDQLAAHAVGFLAQAIADNTQARLIYSDEDKIDERGSRYDPYFKPSWNQDLFYSHNLAAHLCAYRKALAEAAGGFQEGFDGALDYDLTLRCVELIKPHQIRHIPWVLYHCRAHRQHSEPDTKDNVNTASALRALTAHFSRVGIAASAESTEYGLRVKYAIPSSPPLVSLIIPTRNGLDLLRQCVDGITTRTRYPNFEVIIVDNGSDDPQTLAYIGSLALQPRFTVIQDSRPFNYSALNNQAVSAAKGEIIGLLNNDIEVISPDWLDEMVSHALRPEIGAVGAKLLYPDGTFQHGGIILGINGCVGHAHKGFPKDSPGYFGRANLISNYSAVTAACLLIRKNLYFEVGGLNEEHLAVAFNDVDFCLRIAEAGYRNLWTPYAELYHHESATRGTDKSATQKARLTAEEEYMRTHWGKWITSDPAYSPNLTLEHENFSYAYPPRTSDLS